MRSGSARKAWIASLAVALGCLLVAPSAQAAIGFGPGLSAQPADVQAGANSDFTIDIPFTGSGANDSVRDLTVHLPPGLIGNPTATPLCTLAQFQAGTEGSCPDASQVGEVTVNASVDLLGLGIAPLPLPTPITGTIYNMEPQAGEPARFGIVLKSLPFDIPLLGDFVLPPIKQQSGVAVREDDLGLDTVLNDIPNTAEVIRVGPLPPVTADIQITSQTLTLFGVIGGKGFMRNPTSCKEHVVGFDATDHSDESATGQATFTTTGCGNLDFSPELTGSIGAPGRTEPATKPPLTTVIEQAANEAGLRRAQVILPPGVTADAVELGNTCSTPQFQASQCPANTIVGSAVAQSPLLTAPLAGDVSIVEPLQPGGLPNLGVDLKGPLALQLRGDFVLTPGPGNVFEGLPDIPISRFELVFNQDKLIITTRDLCEPPVPAFHADFEGHNGATVSGDFPVDVVGCNGTGAGDPTAKVKLTRSRSEHPRLKAKVRAGLANLKQFKLKLPRQLKLGKKKAFKRGAKATDGSKVGGRKRKAKVTAGDDGATQLKLRVKGKGVDRVKSIKKGKKLRFTITAKDVDGEKTKIKAKAKAR
jgi:hypothetical protein